ncbi:MAG TPA: IPT/TIG domain-containing protein [Planctomycetota bacterium]|nr:IPT/TIG domain-containing protein [Planctomycetota bacterium]
MNYAPLFAGCLATVVLGSAVVGQTFNYPTFSSLSGLTLNGAAVQSGTALRVTNGVSATTGSVWYTTPVLVGEGFETIFEFVMNANPEGLAFVIQGSPAGAAAIGGGIWGIGYGFGVTGTPITNSIAFELDRVQQSFLSDTSLNEISIHTVGALGNSENEGVSIGRITPAINFGNGVVHRIKVNYLHPNLTVFLDNMTTPLFTTPFTFENGGTQLTGGSTGGLGLSGGMAWVGFTASTTSGPSGQISELRSWDWVSFHLPDPCYIGNALVGAGGPYDLLKVNNGPGGFYRLVRLAIADPWSLSLQPPPSEVTAPFVLCAWLGIAGAATVTTTPFGQACFPLIAPIDIGSFVAPYSVNVPPGIALNFPLTLQAIMGTDSANPGRIDLTNAIGMEFTQAPPPTITSRSPNSAPLGGTITVVGNNFSAFATLDINSVPVPPLTVTPTQITFAMPAGVACDSTLRVRNPDGSQATTGFNPTPVITNQVTTSGTSAGGANFILIGTGFAPGTSVTIGGNPATVSSASATAIIALTPPHAPGLVQCVITTPGGCSVTCNYTYL